MNSSLTQITNDIYQVNLPLPFALTQVHCYLVKSKAGWTIFDTGLNTANGRAGWDTAFTQLNIATKDIERIILTHVHPDHYGLAGWLQEKTGATVWMSPREAEQVERVWKQIYLPNSMANLLHMSGVPAELYQKAALETNKTLQMTLPHPQDVDLIEPGSIVTVGKRQFQTIHAPGHSDGQLIFYDAADQLMLCGDQVLMRISPNIGMWPISDPNPLGKYLASLQELAAVTVRLALPGHGKLITDWQGRLAELQQHHDDRLNKILAAINGQGTTTYNVSATIFKNVEQFDAHEIRFAVAETLAHLEYLVQEQRLHREDSEVWLYFNR